METSIAGNDMQNTIPEILSDTEVKCAKAYIRHMLYCTWGNPPCRATIKTLHEVYGVDPERLAIAIKCIQVMDVLEGK